MRGGSWVTCLGMCLKNSFHVCPANSVCVHYPTFHIQLQFSGPSAAGSSQCLPQACQGQERAFTFFLRLSSGRPYLTGRKMHASRSQDLGQPPLQTLTLNLTVPHILHTSPLLHTDISPLYHSLSLQDPCLNVRTLFLQKLHKGLATYKLPLSYLAILCLYGDEEDKSLKAAVSFLAVSS